MTEESRPVSDRTTVRRGANRAEYDTQTILEILDAAMVAHVGVITDDGPIVLPMVYGRTDDTLYLHGSAANAMLRAGVATDICATITLVDGLVIARSAFHNSMNYRSVVIRGEARRVTDPAEIEEALVIITDHVVENWDSRRPATDKELRATMVIALPLAEASAKVRAEGAIDDEADHNGPEWVGTIAITSTWDAPISGDDNTAPVPDAIAAMAGTPVQ